MTTIEQRQADLDRLARVLRARGYEIHKVPGQNLWHVWESWKLVGPITFEQGCWSSSEPFLEALLRSVLGGACA